jgi:hypothetical protein
MPTSTLILNKVDKFKKELTHSNIIDLIVFPSSPSLKAGLNTIFLSSKSNLTLQKGDKEGSKHSDKCNKFL